MTKHSEIWTKAHEVAASEMPRLKSGLCQQPGLAAVIANFAIEQTETQHNIANLIQACADITEAKGFDTTQHATQIALIATEVAESLECVTTTNDSRTRDFISNLIVLCENYETYRKAIRKPEHPYCDTSQILDQKHLNEELADIVIRVFSYAGGNGQKEGFVQTLVAKIEKNKERPMLHGKAF